MGDGLSSLSLCPGKLSKIRCLHSYLSLYHQMQNGRTDSVSLRNIGKRDGSNPYVKKGGLMCPQDMDKVQCYNNAIAYYIRLMQLMS